jgi:hypothetical protein
MTLAFTAESVLEIGHGLVLEGVSPSAPYQVVFEDDEETGYFYACALEEGVCHILDVVHIYNVMDVSDKHIPSLVEIFWTSDGLKSILLINNYPDAVFDFKNKRGYCRAGFPPPTGSWNSAENTHEWDDAVLNLLVQEEEQLST